MRISLSWGAQLYTMDASPEVSDDTDRLTFYATGLTVGNKNGKSTSDLMAAPPMSKDESWSQLTSAAMTSMAISLDFITLIRNLIASPAYDWGLRHFEEFLNALEVSHWHAFCFNENTPLRLQLHQRGFMNKNRSDSNPSNSLPHLLEQEVASVEQILFTIYKLYCLETHHQQQSANEGIQSAKGSLFGAMDKDSISRLPFTIADAARVSEPFIERYVATALLSLDFSCCE